MKQKLFLILFCLILLIPTTMAATIHGTVYNIELNKLNNAIVEINTIPKQTMVSKLGVYSFNAPNGEYKIIATHLKLDLQTKENIIIKEKGDYNVDLILFPNLETEESILEETEMDISDPYTVEESTESKEVFQRMAITLAVFLSAIIFYIIYHKLKDKKEKKKQETESIPEKKRSKSDIDKLMDFIKKQGGRATQKDIRKNFPQSEAKISLMIADLESQKKIKKIKKGRGNIIILT